MNKTISFKMPSKPASTDAWVEQGVEPHLKAAPGVSDQVEAKQVKIKRFTIDVPQELHARVKITCAQRGLNMADELRRILEHEFPVVS